MIWLAFVIAFPLLADPDTCWHTTGLQMSCRRTSEADAELRARWMHDYAAPVILRMPPPLYAAPLNRALDIADAYREVQP